MSFTFVYYSSSDLFWCISISGILHNGGIPECDGRDVREHPPPWDTHSGELAGRLQCLEAIPSFIFIEKKHDPWKLQNFSGNTDLGHVFMFSPQFLQKMLWCSLRRSEYRQQRACGILSWGRTRCLCPWGEDAVSPSPGCSWCSVRSPALEGLLSDSAGAEQAPSCRCHSGLFVWGVGGHRAECGQAGSAGLRREGRGGGSGRRAGPGPVGGHLRALRPAGLHWVCFRCGLQVGPSPLILLGFMWVNFRRLFSYLVWRPRLLILTSNLPFDTSSVSCQHK